MRKILALTICLWTVAAYGEPQQAILPPAEYDYYPPGGYRVFTVPTHSELVRMCGEGHAPFPSCLLGKDQNGACVILALPRLDMPALGYNYDDVKRHEFGHCNGWPKDHAGMRSRPSPDPYEEAEKAWKKTPEGAQWEKETTRWRQLEEENVRKNRDEESRAAWERWQKSRQGTKK
jgi:hypothetical protein